MGSFRGFFSNKSALLELSASSADDAPVSQRLMGLMGLDNLLLSEKQHHKRMSPFSVFSTAAAHVSAYHG